MPRWDLVCKRCTEEGAGEIGECLQILMQGPVEEKREERKNGVGRVPDTKRTLNRPVFGGGEPASKWSTSRFL